MDITFDKNNEFLGIPKGFFDISAGYKPSGDYTSSGIASILDSAEKSPFVPDSEDEKLKEHPFYKYPQYQYAVLTYLAHLAEKTAKERKLAEESNDDPDDIFMLFFAQLLSYLKNNKNNPDSYYDKNGNIALGAGRLKKMFDNELRNLSKKSDNKQYRQVDNKRKYIKTQNVSLDSPVEDRTYDFGDRATTLADTLFSNESSYNAIEMSDVLDRVRNTFPRYSDEWVIANELASFVLSGDNDIKNKWAEIANMIGLDQKESKFITKRKHVLDKLRNDLKSSFYD